MSKETSRWLNMFTLIGYVLKRGRAWHYRQSEQGVEPNHYDGAIPVADVVRRLFSWTADETPLYIGDMSAASGFRKIDGRKAIVRSDTRDVLGVFKDGYTPPNYAEWCLQNVANLIDDQLGIGSAGLLRNGAQAWVQVEMPETVTTPEGVDFRPFLLACDSADGSLARTYRTGSQLVVCDNTLSAALNADGATYKLKHTRNSVLRISDARDALEIVHTMAEDFAADIAALCSQDVTERAFNAVLDVLVPVCDAQGQPLDKGRTLTLAERKRDELSDLYNADPRVAPWAGTAFGVLQAFNTHAHHFGTVRNVSRAERNMANAITGKTDAADRAVLAALELVAV